MKKQLLTVASIACLLTPIVRVGAESTADKMAEIKAQIESLQAEYDKLASENGSSTTESASSQTSETNKADWGKRSNPVPIGEMIEVKEMAYANDKKFEAVYQIGVTSVIRGEEAFNLLLENSSYQKPAPEGFEWVVIDLKMGYLSGDEDEAFRTPSNFKVFDKSGKEVKQTEYANFSNDQEFHYVEVYPSSSHEGKIGFHVKSGEEFSLVLDTYGHKYFFSTK